MGARQSNDKITEQDKAILKLKVQKDALRKYQKNLNEIYNVVLTSAIAENSKQIKSNKVKRLLKIKRLIEKNGQHMENIDELVFSVQQAVTDRQVLESLENGNKALKELQQKSPEEVQELLDNIADTIADQNEIDMMLGGLLSPEDDEEIERELEQLQADEILGEIPNVPVGKLPDQPVSDKIPSVPTHTPGQRDSEMEVEGPKQQAAKPSKQKQAMLAS